MAQIGAAVAILPSAPIAVRSNDVEFIYRQDSDLYYLTGFAEPESVALLAPGHKDGEFVMFVRPRDRERETWTGRRAGVEGAMLEYGADKAYTLDEFDRVLARYLEGVERVYYPLGHNERINARVLELMRGAQAMRPRTGSGPIAMLDPRELIHEARLKKRPEELDAMRRAAAISREAHIEAMRRARGGMMEWEIEAVVDYAFRSRGASGPSYPSIIASGPNAATLHYIHNDRRMAAGELLLIDAGCEYDFYASDVTRTFPVGARFIEAQRALYSVVLEAQRRGIEAARRAFRRRARSSVARAGRGHDRSRPHQGTAGRRARDLRLSPLLHASHQPLAGYGCPRRRALPHGRKLARARALDGADGGTGYLHRRR